MVAHSPVIVPCTIDPFLSSIVTVSLFNFIKNLEKKRNSHHGSNRRKRRSPSINPHRRRGIKKSASRAIVNVIGLNMAQRKIIYNLPNELHGGGVKGRQTRPREIGNGSKVWTLERHSGRPLTGYSIQ